MNVKNRKCVYRLSIRSLWASRKRNMIAIIAIALTTLMFTSLFTVLMSLNASYQTYQFRQLGGYCHGSFKDVTDEQAERITTHPKVKQAGVRTVIGTISEGVFAKIPAEVSYMDENCTKWSYAEPTTGRMPVGENEITMDTGALALLGITPEIGTEVNLTYTLFNKEQFGDTLTDTFKLVGYWEYDDLMPVHYINISEEYADQIEVLAIASGMDDFRTDLSVMMAREFDIRGQMEQVDLDLGYTWEDRNAENNVRIGVNWAYTTEQMSSMFDMETLIAVAAFLVLVVLTGYLIIYNIFQISVAGDIRFYGLLKTIGVTPRQLRRIIRLQAVALCMIGIPIGILLGYGIGAFINPIVMESSTYGSSSSTMSMSPFIFIFAAAFSLATVLLSCWRPGRIASRVSPVEATHYTEHMESKKKTRRIRGAKIPQMAFANLGRNKSKTALVVISLSLSVVLLNILCTFVNGFDMEKYLSKSSCADFVVSSPEYFRYEHVDEYITQHQIKEIEDNTNQTVSGCGYMNKGGAFTWITETAYRSQRESYMSEDSLNNMISSMEHRGEYVKDGIQLEGLDESLMSKLVIYDGSLDDFSKKDGTSIAIVANVDDYGRIENPEIYPKVGEHITVTYVSDYYFIDSRTGELCDENTPQEYLDIAFDEKDVDYTVCALVGIPYSMSCRYYTIGGWSAVLPVDVLKTDSGQEVIPFVYLFDTPDEVAETDAENYLAELTADKLSPLTYESKATQRVSFEQFRNMFLMVGGLLCAVIAMIGILNYMNAIITGIFSRGREFAVLQAVGMTTGQLKKMLILEGIFYALGSVCSAGIVLLVLGRLIGNLMENMFWFFSYHVTVLPIVVTIPIFALMGCLVPMVIYNAMRKSTIVEQLRNVE